MSNPEKPNSTSVIGRLLSVVLAFGPGIFAIGYTIGTGSVTSMIVAGSEFGMQLLWVLLLSCFFSGILIYTYGKYALVSGKTALFSFRNYVKYGKYLALFIFIAVSFGQWGSLMGILAISSNIIFEILDLNFPGLSESKYAIVLIIATIIMTIFYGIMLIGKYSFFEKLLVIFVSIMGFSFIFSLFFVHPLPQDVILGLVPTIPNADEGGYLMVAAFVGTTMAAATFLSRPLFIQGKGWTINDMGQQKNDAIMAAVLVFVISGAIMAVAHGALFVNGEVVDNVLDMSKPLEPIAGKFAVSIFFFGTLSAGLSSIFPCLLIAPLLLADYQSGELDTKSKQFRIITFIACLAAMVGPVLGAKPIQVQILSQVFNVFALPAVVLGIIILVNNKDLMKGTQMGTFVKVGLWTAFIFSLIVSATGIIGLLEL